MWIPSYDYELLHLAEDLARRMLPAFDTPTGMELVLVIVDISCVESVLLRCWVIMVNELHIN